MTTIERGHATVRLYSRTAQAELDAIQAEMMAEFVKEESAGPRRAGAKSKASELARKYDERLAVEESAAVEVELHEISGIEWESLADEHPPRDDDARDKKMGWNVRTFQPALLRASIGETDLDIDALSLAHKAKLYEAVWNLHNADDALPKGSMQLLLKQYREAASKQPPDSE